MIKVGLFFWKKKDVDCVVGGRVSEFHAIKFNNYSYSAVFDISSAAPQEVNCLIMALSVF